MAGLIKVIGKTVTLLVEESINGLMGGVMMENSQLESNMGKANIVCLQGKHIQGLGRKV